MGRKGKVGELFACALRVGSCPAFEPILKTETSGGHKVTAFLRDLGIDAVEGLAIMLAVHDGVAVACIRISLAIVFAFQACVKVAIRARRC